MQFSSVNIGFETRAFLQGLWQKGEDYVVVNQGLKSVCGISDFFENKEDYNELRRFLTEEHPSVRETDRTEYGDFQTNLNLASRIAYFLKEKGCSPQTLIEPTFGKGNFILAALQHFPQLQQIRGVEIFKPYVWEAKFSILDFFLKNQDRSKPDIRLFHQNVFDFDFQKLSRELSGEILILGNPPWVTNAKLGTLNSANLPTKSNYKNLNGLDAMTGKGNFDIGEYITLTLLRAFQNHSGQIAFLVKNQVIKNIVFDQKAAKLRIGELKQFPIDAKKEFSAAVEASLFFCKLNQTPEYQCAQIQMLLDRKPDFHFGWQENQFVANAEKYEAFKSFDGGCPFEWRQGLKHDCSEVMELERLNGHFVNRNGQSIQLENDLVYGILKSSDLKGGVVSTARKFTIVTQRSVGQDTAYIQSLFPKTYSYLRSHQEIFANRKSSIYRNKPLFSIFGIGEYSFAPYKVAISGLYKTPVFTLVLPENDKPLMLDDTCYFIGFEKFSDAVIVFTLLNHPFVTGLLEAITFPDAKRTFTKDVLMRIDLQTVAGSVNFIKLAKMTSLAGLKEMPDESDFSSFCQKIKGVQQLQFF
ncbi:MAG: class I SAM-dependent methyltransferase [Saprospiraceae bacterium]